METTLPRLGHRGRYLNQMLKNVLTFTAAYFVAVASVVGCDRGTTDMQPSKPAASNGTVSFDRPQNLAGTWRWQWSAGHKMILHADGRAERIEGRPDHVHRNGVWRLRDDGVLEVTTKIEFRVDDDAETIERFKSIALMDIETISTDHDFEWVKADSDAGRAH